MSEIQDFVKIWATELLDALTDVFKKWYFLLLAAAIGGTIGYYKIRNVQPTYSANITFVLSTEQKGNSGLSGLAAQLGMDATTSSSDNIFAGENIIELFKSRSLIGAALQSKLTTGQTLLNFIAQHQYGERYKKLGPFANERQHYTAAQTRLYRHIISYVAGSFKVYKKDKKLIFYIISTTSTNPDIAYFISRYVLATISQTFIDTKTKVAITGLTLLKHEADSLAVVLSNLYSSNAAAIDRTYNLNPSISVQRSGSLFAQARATALASAYTEVMRNLEVAKINVQKETPLYKIIDEPELPLVPSGTNKMRHILLAALTGLFFMLFLLLANFFYTKHYTSSNGRYA